jgi:hypothetical protein
MTVHGQIQDRPTATAGIRSRRVIAIAGAAVIVVAVTLLILVVGLVPLPSFPRLADTPDAAIPGTIAYVRGDAERVCVSTVPAGGGPARDVVCRRFGLDAVAWTAGGALAVTTYDGPVPEIIVFDASTGAELDRVEWRRDGPVEEWSRQRLSRPDGARLLLGEGVPGQAVVRVREPDGSSRVLFRADGPQDYTVTGAQWAPDGRWVLIADSRGRLLIVAAEGGANPRIVADRAHGFGGFAWHIPGETTYTFEVPDS